MAKSIDLTGQKFGKLTALKIIGTDKNYNKIWLCQCDCGNTCEFITSELRSGHKKSCGKCRYIDLTGQRFGRLTVIGIDSDKSSKKVIFWKCKCDCGNEKSINGGALKIGATKSCGCLNKEILSQEKDLSDMIGRKFGNLTVIKRADTHITHGGQRKVMWLCKCDCGNEKVVASQDLKSGHTKSCGCMPKKKRGSGLIDLIGKRYGKLTVVKRVEDYECKSKKTGILRTPQWLCRCDCGNYIIAQGGNLRRGCTTNCGCDRVYSVGEKLISDYLIKNNIKHLREYTFEDLRNKKGNYLRFDFGILNNNSELVMLIEFQGRQHYIDGLKFGSYQRNYSDKIKRDYCKQNNIPLYEIKYNDDLESVLSNIFNKNNEI